MATMGNVGPTRRPLRAVVFDLDGTLIDSAPDLRTALNRMLTVHGRPTLGLDSVIGMVGDGATKLVARAFAATGDPAADADLDALTRQFLDVYEHHAAVETRPYPGAVEALGRLQEAGLRLGICTNKPQRATDEALIGLGLAPYFDTVVGGDALDGVRKPDPRLLLAALKRMDVKPSEAAMVGDNANDVAAARAADVPVIVRDGGYTRVPSRELGADAVFSSFTDLPAVLAGLP